MALILKSTVLPFGVIVMTLMFCHNCLLGQQPPYIPLSHVFSDYSSILRKNEDSLQRDLAKITSNKKLQALYKKRYTMFEAGFQKGDYVNDHRFNSFFQKILKNITSANPEIPAGDIQLYLGDYTWPNATCYGDGNFIFNLGLLRRLENESQVAFVLCHEIAHYMLEHVPNAMQEHCERLNSKETKARIKQIRKMKYGKRAQALALMQDFVFEGRRHSRFAESAADSLGLVYLMRTNYDPHAAISCLMVLDSCDLPKYQAIFDPSKLFVHPDYPFLASWLPEDNSFEYAERAILPHIDSLKTHPDCRQRIEWMKRKLGKEPITAKSDSVNMGFMSLVRIADFEQVEAFYRRADLGACIFAAYQLLQIYPEHPWLINRISICFYRMYLARKDHDLAKYLEALSPKQEESYALLIGILNNLRMSEMAKTGFYFLAAHIDKLQDNEISLGTYALLASACGKEELASRAEKEFYKKNPTSKYLEMDHH